MSRKTDTVDKKKSKNRRSGRTASVSKEKREVKNAPRKSPSPKAAIDERRGNAHRPAPARAPDPAEGPEALADLSEKIEAIRVSQERLSARIEGRIREIEDDLRDRLYELQDAIGERLTEKERAYRLMVRHVRRIVAQALPSDATFAVIARPDRDLLSIHGRRGECLPQRPDGEYTGYYPACDTAALAQLEAVRSKGAAYLVVPYSAIWWLQHYRGLKRHLDRNYRLVVDEPDACAIYDLGRPSPRGILLGQIDDAISRFETAYGRRPAILDWGTDLDLSSAFPHDTVFAPPTPGPPVDYLDGSVDLVVHAADNPGLAEEADRVAGGVVIRVPARGTPDPVAAVQWKRSVSPSTRQAPTVSIIVPCYNQVDRTRSCLARLRETLPEYFEGEVVVVDDGSSDGTARELARIQEVDDRIRVIRNAANLGFVDSCNAAARTATGEILVFLNNDTIPLPNWLDPLLRVLARFADAGAVGGRLVYPEGTLQEAGGIVFSDGTAANFGRDDYNPDHPLYTYLREVDYCSGALLATRRDVFASLGGFDRRYSPAYYEDTDYCFRLRENGLKVYYQPESTVVHYEGATAGVDISTGTKRYQTINRETFLGRWRDTLAQQRDRPAEFEFATFHSLAVRGRRPKPTKESGRAMICALMPEFDRDSGSRRVLALVESLQAQGWSVTFVSHHENPQAQYVRNLERRGVNVYSGDGMWMEPLISTGDYDLVFLGLWDIAERHIGTIRSLSPGTRIVVDSIDLHFLRNARRLFRTDGAVQKRLDSDYGGAMVRELNTYASADAILTVSQKEADLINDLVCDDRLAQTVPDGEDTPPRPLPLAERRGIVFVGCFRHTPNADAMAYLCQEILPRIDRSLLERHPVYIVGDGMTDDIRRLGAGQLHLKMVGWVPSVEPYLRRSRVSVVPLRYGAGTKRKLVEALLNGTPSVSTPIGTEGLGLEHGKHVLVGTDAASFADAVGSLLQDDELWKLLQNEGRAHVIARHTTENYRQRLAEVVASVLARSPKPGEPPARVAGTRPQKMGREEYAALIERIRQTVEETLAETAAVAVVSRGDEDLLELGRRRTWHFPQDQDGAYPGHYPKGSEDAIGNLQSIEAQGATHVLFPDSALWWLEHYTGLKEYLDSHYAVTVDTAGTCRIFQKLDGGGDRRGSRVDDKHRGESANAPIGEEKHRASDAGTPACSGTDAVRLIAFYLPQFHPIPENDRWWGPGFTEWTKVTSSRPVFPGHYQPHLPADLGFYDLRLEEARDAQAEMAKTYGIHGFCYYHYWFAGKQLLERPFDAVLRSGRPDFPFCLCWANEPWSRRWDGRDRDVLQAQTYSEGDDHAHIRWLLNVLADPRAIRIAGKPVFVVYQARSLPYPARTADLWRSEALRAGLGELYLMTVETGWDAGWDATRMGFDAKILFQPQFASLFNSGQEIDVSAKRRLRVFDYGRAWPVLGNPAPVAYRRYDTVCTSWDNTARRGDEAVVLHGSTPEAYERWLTRKVSEAGRFAEGERVVFINAWNEWAEGCHLEPDQRHGRAYLEATRRALASLEIGARVANR